MKTFKQYIIEDLSDFKFKTREEVLQWFEKLQSVGEHCSIPEGKLVVDSNGSMIMQHWMMAGPNDQQQVIPVQFRRVKGTFSVNGCGLINFHGCPETVDGTFACWSNPATSLEGCPKNVGNDFDARWLFGVSNLSGIHKIVKKIGGAFTIPNTVTSSVLGLLMIPFWEIKVSMTAIPVGSKLPKVVEIVNRHSKERDVLECQEELISAGFKEYAKL
jgi:hypothetical protein